MKRFLAALLLVGTGRVHAGDRIDPSAPSDTEQLRGSVLVWTDATLYTEPDDAATTLHAASVPAARKNHAGEVMPMHVVAVTKDGFVEVEPADDVECTWSRLETSDDIGRLRLFVKRADLAPVLVTPFEKVFENGTRIALRPGVPLAPTSGGKWVVGLRGGEVIVDLPPGTVGHAYTADKSKRPAAIADDREYSLAPNTAVKLGDRSFVLGDRRANAVERRGDTTLFVLKGRCVEVAVSVPSKAVRVIDEDEVTISSGSSSGVGVLEMRDHDYIPAGTQLATPSGHLVAAAAKPIYLTAAPHGKTACFERRIRVEAIEGEALDPTDDDNKLKLCAPSGRVLHERVRSASAANGASQR
jgi:hypothetical protein